MKKQYGIYNTYIGVESSTHSGNESYEHLTCKCEIVDNLEIKCDPVIKLKRAEAEQIRNIVTGDSLGFTPDIQAITMEDELIFIEIVKTSDIDERKMELIKQLDITTIRIYVNDTYSKYDTLKINTVYCRKNSLYNNLYTKSIEKLNLCKESLEEHKKTIEELKKIINTK